MQNYEQCGFSVDSETPSGFTETPLETFSLTPKRDCKRWERKKEVGRA